MFQFEVLQNMNPFRVSGKTGHREVLVHREIEKQPPSLPIFRDQDQAAVDSVRRVLLIQPLAIEPDLTFGFLITAHQAFKQFGSAGTHQTVDAEDFAFVHGEGDMVQGIATTIAGQGHVLDAKQLVARLMSLPAEELFRITPHHLLYDLGHLYVFDFARMDEPGVPKNRDVVADYLHFLKTMGDIDNSHAVPLQIFRDPEEHLYLLNAQRRGRLVHDQNLRFLDHGLCNLNDLLLPKAKITNWGARSYVLSQSLQDRCCLFGLTCMINVS